MKPTKAQQRAAAQILGHKGGMARKRNLSPAERQRIARNAAKARWNKRGGDGV